MVGDLATELAADAASQRIDLLACAAAKPGK